MSGLYYGVGVALDAEGEVDRVWIGKFDVVQRSGNAYIDESWRVTRVEERPIWLLLSARRRPERERGLRSAPRWNPLRGC